MTDFDIYLCLKCTNCTLTLDLVTRKLNYVACEQQRCRSAHLYSLIHTFIVSSMDSKIAKLFHAKALYSSQFMYLMRLDIAIPV